MTRGGAHLRLAVAVLGVLSLVMAGVLYADLSGLTDYVFLDAGVLTFRLPLRDPDRVVHTPFAAGDLRDIARVMAIVGAVIALPVGVLVFRRWRGRLAEWMRRWPRGPQGAIALGLAGAVAVAYVPLGEGSLLSIYYWAALAGVLLLFGAIGRSGLETVSAAVERVRVHVAAAPGWSAPVGFALLLLLVATMVSVTVFDRTPHVVDAVSHLFQARIFATGQLYLESHPLREFFDVDTVVNDGRWYSQYPPGHSLLLLLGEAAGVPWMVNPVLGALSVLALFFLAEEIYGEATARLAALLAALSPFVVLMSAEFYSHSSTLLFVTLFVLHYVRFVKRGRPSSAMLAGTFLGLAALTRPLSALAASLPFAVDALLRAGELRNRRRLVGAALGMAVLTGLCLALLAYNRATTGDPLTFGYGLAAGPGFGVGEVELTRSLERLRLLNDALFAWPLPGLAFVLVAFLGCRPARWDYLLIAMLATLLLAHAAVGYRDAEFGPRYLFEASSALVLLTARGILASGEVLRRFGASFVEEPPRAVGGVVTVLFVVGALMAWYPRLYYYQSPHWKWAVHDDAWRAAEAVDLSNAIVFVSEPQLPNGERWWESVFLQNAIPVEASDVIYARDLGDRNEELRRFYAARTSFLARGEELVPIR